MTRAVTSVLVLGVAAVGVGCQSQSTGEDAGGDVGSDAGAVTDDADSGLPPAEHAVEHPCGDRSPGIVACRDRVEESLGSQWSTPAESDTLARGEPAVWGEKSIQGADAEDGIVRLRYEAEEPIDASGPPAVAFQVAVRARHTRPLAWRGDNPRVTFEDDEGRTRTMAPGGVRGPWGDARWKRIAVPVEPRDGWREVGGEGDSGFDAGAIRSVEFEFESWGDSLQVWLDGLSSTRGGRVCEVDCPQDCGEHGTCRPAHLGCVCEQGAVGPACGECADGWRRGDDGSCELESDSEATTWPNDVSDANSDPWLVEHAGDVEVLKPRVLVLNFANGSDAHEVDDLVEQEVASFRRASTYRGVEGADSEPQLQYQIAKTVDFRNGRAGNPDTPAGWSHDNSSLLPRREDPRTGETEVDYGAFFGEEFAEHYDFEPREDGESPPGLCELVDQGRVHEVWLVAAHEEADAVPAEVLEYKQRYTVGDNPIPGKFEPCAGNGCFDRDVSPCERSIRIGFINYERGPGCFVHSIGHGVEWTGNRFVVPSFSDWFRDFAGFRLDRRFGLPLEDLYEIDCEETPCVSYPQPDRIELDHKGESYASDGWDGACGNVHFPPNGRKHYDYEAPNPARSSCPEFGHPGEQCGSSSATEVTPSAWSQFNSEVPDCGGGFLVWWFQHMPGGGATAYHDDGRPMTPVWPVLFW